MQHLIDRAAGAARRDGRIRDRAFGQRHAEAAHGWCYAGGAALPRSWRSPTSSSVGVQGPGQGLRSLATVSARTSPSSAAPAGADSERGGASGQRFRALAASTTVAPCRRAIRSTNVARLARSGRKAGRRRCRCRSNSCSTSSTSSSGRRAAVSLAWWRTTATMRSSSSRVAIGGRHELLHEFVAEKGRRSGPETSGHRHDAIGHECFSRARDPRNCSRSGARPEARSDKPKIFGQPQGHAAPRTTLRGLSR